MDDTPDKLRRNIVVLSAAILAIAFFHLSFKPTGTLLGFAEVGNVSAFKVWLALSAVLAYAFLRYRFDAATGESLSAMRDEFDRFVKLAVTHRAERAVSRYLIQGTQHWLPYWIRDIDRFVDQVAKDAAFLGTDTRPVSAEIRATRRELSRDSDLFCDEADSPWRGEFTFTYAAQWEFDGGTSFGSCGGYSKSAYIYEMYGLGRPMLLATALLRAPHSKGAIDVVLPFVLSGLAMLVCLYKIAFYFSAAGVRA